MSLKQATPFETFENSQANSLLNSLNILFSEGRYFVEHYLTVRIFYKHSLNNDTVKMWMCIEWWAETMYKTDTSDFNGVVW